MGNLLQDYYFSFFIIVGVFYLYFQCSYLLFCDFKGIVHLKRKILSSFTHPYVVPNLSYVERKIYFEECW